MKTGDPIWILNRKNEIQWASTISKIGSKWGYFSFYTWDKQKFCLKTMRIEDTSSCGGMVFLSEQAANEHIQKEKLEREIRGYFNNYHKFQAEDYTLECLVQIKTLLELKHLPF